MGNFYTNLTVRGAALDEVVELMGHRHAFVAGMGEDVVVFDEECESQDPRILTALGAQLSLALRLPVVTVLNHDDDVLLVQLFRDGMSVFDYDSSPGYFDGEEQPTSPINVEALCEVFGASDSALEAILDSDDYEFMFAVDRHRRLYEALGLPLQAVGYGYSYISEGDLPVGLDRTDLVEVGGSAWHKGG